jgi:tRNA uridine 5-carboxymethylaminomethyl modification enzyme
MSEQRGDEHPTFFAFHDTRGADAWFHVEHRDQERLGWKPGERQVSCWITHTSPTSEQIVRENLHKSAMYSGEIMGVGPRYCPSIEDKFIRFAEKERHMLFLEPEGRSTDEYYINGLSTSLPFDVQVQLVHSIPGLERAEIVRPAYAVEYDFAPPTQLRPSLESKFVEGLFFAGQINGTSGYEEAAGQGIIAGTNAAQKVRGGVPLVLSRHEAYIGVMIDDLVTKGTREPYRMFTSRAEHRLLLNHGSAELRLSERAGALGLIDGKRLENIRAKRSTIEHWVSWLETNRVGDGSTWAELIRRGGAERPEAFEREAAPARDEVLYRIAFKGYIERQQRDVERLASADRVRIAPEFDFLATPGLKRESAEKLARVRPETLGQASRISGVNPADIAILMIALAKRERSAGS